MKKSTMLALGCGAAAAGALGGNVITHTLINTALDRKEPAIMKNAMEKISGFGYTKELSELIRVSGERLRAQPIERVTVTTHDGITLVGHWYPHKNPRRVLIAMHGWRSSWDHDFGAISPFWHDSECSVLYPDQRGQNESGGEHMGFGILERYDCLDWIRWVVEHCGKDIPIYLCGISMGATSVMMASALNMPPSVKGIIADSGYTSLHEIWKHVVRDNLHLSYGIRGHIAHGLCKKKISIGSKDYSTVQALKESRLPVLFIHGTADSFVPVEMTYENYQACKPPKRLLIVPGADHGMSYIADRERYEAASRQFWLDFDGVNR